jgi:transcriptional regulator with XRE-family HTH domain
MRRRRYPVRPEAVPTDESLDLTPAVSANFRRLRTRSGLSLERLSRASGVSRATLGRLELGRSAPTIDVLWKIARALGVSLSALVSDRTAARPIVIRAAESKVFGSPTGTFVSRALFPFDAPRSVEFHELRLAPASVERADPRPPGTRESLVVAWGDLRLVFGRTRHRLATGDAILFDADLPHEYWNETSEPLQMYRVMTSRNPRTVST